MTFTRWSQWFIDVCNFLSHNAPRIIRIKVGGFIPYANEQQLREGRQRRISTRTRHTWKKDQLILQDHETERDGHESVMEGGKYLRPLFFEPVVCKLKYRPVFIIMSRSNVPAMRGPTTKRSRLLTPPRRQVKDKRLDREMLGPWRP